MKLKALRALRYAGKSVLKGGVFECRPGDVRLLVGAKIAENYVEPIAPRKTVAKIVPAIQERVDAMVDNGSITAEDAAQVLEHPSTHEPVGKRAYKRKDLVAE